MIISMGFFVLALLPAGAKLGERVYRCVVGKILLRRLEDLTDFAQLDLFVREMVGLLSLQYEGYIAPRTEDGLTE